MKHKESTTATILHRALKLPNTTEGRNRELDKVCLQFKAYPSKFNHNTQTRMTSSSMISSPEELVGMFFKLLEPLKPYNSFASLPYIKGVTEPLTRWLKKHHINVVNRPLKRSNKNFRFLSPDPH